MLELGHGGAGRLGQGGVRSRFGLVMAHGGCHLHVAADTSGVRSVAQCRLEERAALGWVRGLTTFGEVALEAGTHAGEVRPVTAAKLPKVWIVRTRVSSLGLRPIEAVRACILGVWLSRFRTRASV